MGLYTTRLLLDGVVHHEAAAGWGCIQQTAAGWGGIVQRTAAGWAGIHQEEYARTCCWLGSVLLLEVGVVRHDLLLVRLGMYTTRLGDHGQLLAGVVDHELLLARLG